MEELLRDASTVLVDAECISNLSGGNLKCGSYYRNLLELINKYRYKRNKSIFDKFKSAMFEDTCEEIKASKELADYTYLLSNCIKCKCAKCALISDSCKCKSCIYGSYVTECKHNKRIHATDPKVIHLDGYNDISLLVDLDSGEVFATGMDRFGIEREVKIQ